VNHRTLPVSVAVTVLFAFGCGTKSAPATPDPVSVSGTVCDATGKPVANMMLAFRPEDAGNQGQRPMALVNADGKFRTRCLPGKYTVSLTALPRGAGHAADPAAASPPEKGSKETTGASWEVNVLSNGRDDLKLTVK